MSCKEPQYIRDKFHEMKRKGRIPEKSKDVYYKEYNRYMQWREEEEKKRIEEENKKRQEQLEKDKAEGLGGLDEDSDEKAGGKSDDKLDENCHTDAVVMMYLAKRTDEVVPPSLFKILSMLKACIAVEHNIEIVVTDLNPILASKGKGYLPKQAPTLTREQISSFLQQPDAEFLPQKVRVCTPPQNQIA